MRAPGTGQERFAEVLAEIDHPAVLIFVALFCDAGRERAAAAMERMQMPAEDRVSVEFLIENQAQLFVAMTRDLDDPAAVRGVADLVGTVEHLKLLLLLTYGAISAAGPDKACSERLDRLWRAYSITRDELTRELETARIEQAPGELRVSPEFVRGFPTRYLRSHTPAEIDGALPAV